MAPLLLPGSLLPETREPYAMPALLNACARRQTANEIAFGPAIHGFALMLPAVVGAVRLLRRRAVALGHVGGALAIVGLASLASVAGAEFLLVAGADPTLNREALQFAALACIGGVVPRQSDETWERPPERGPAGVCSETCNVMSRTSRASAEECRTTREVAQHEGIGRL